MLIDRHHARFGAVLGGGLRSQHDQTKDDELRDSANHLTILPAFRNDQFP